jgi:hypothetical protein
MIDETEELLNFASYVEYDLGLNFAILVKLGLNLAIWPGHGALGQSNMNSGVHSSNLEFMAHLEMLHLIFG